MSTKNPSIQRSNGIVIDTEDALFKNVFERSSVGMSITYPNGVMNANSAFFTMLGYTEEEFLRRKWQSITHPDDIEISTKNVALLLNGKCDSVCFEKRYLSKDGTIIWAEVNAVLQKDQQQKPLYFISTIINITDRKMALEAEMRFEQLFRNNPALMALASPPQYRFTDANDAFLSVLGFNREEVIGKTAAELRLFENQEHMKEFEDRMLRDGRITNFEIPFRRKDGVILQGVISSEPVTIQGMTCFMSVMTDITERKKFEEKERIANEMLRAIAENTPDHIIVQDCDLRYTFVSNPQLGLTIEDMMGKTDADFLKADDAEKLTVIKKNVIKSGVPYHLETSLLNTTGNLEYFDGNFIPKHDSSGVINGLIGYFRNVTERKRIENALKENTALLQSAIDILPVGLWILNEKGKIVTCSTAAQKIWAGVQYVNIDEFGLYKGWRTDTGKLIEPHEWAGARALEKGETTIEQEVEIECFDGTHKIILDSAVPLRKTDGSIGGAVTVNMDITERKNAEKILQNSQKLESLGILAGGIAHDFNNLLGGIFGYIDNSIEAGDPSLMLTNLKKAAATIERARALTRQLLTFAKGGEPIKKHTAISPFLEDTAKFALSGSNALCTFQIPENIWGCDIDKNQMSQVVDNIVINAHQAMPEGGNIEISAENFILTGRSHLTLPGGNYVRIAIKDHGIGMPKEILSKIFDPFYTTKIKGHGLGLATCYSIIKRHGGCIDVVSEPGKGSTFFIYLPASIEPIPKESAIKETIHQGSGSILIMEDEEFIRDMLTSMLQSMGYQIKTAPNSKETMDEFERALKNKNPFSFIILDLTIPGEAGGKEVIREIRKIDKDTPVFVASGYADDPVMSNPTDYGFNGSICKPFKKTELADLLNKHFKKN